MYLQPLNAAPFAICERFQLCSLRSVVHRETAAGHIRATPSRSLLVRVVAFLAGGASGVSIAGFSARVERFVVAIFDKAHVVPAVRAMTNAASVSHLNSDAPVLRAVLVPALEIDMSDRFMFVGVRFIF